MTCLHLIISATKFSSKHGGHTKNVYPESNNDPGPRTLTGGLRVKYPVKK